MTVIITQLGALRTFEPLSADHPAVLAWQAWVASDNYAIAMAAPDKATSLWQAFFGGWGLAATKETER